VKRATVASEMRQLVAIIDQAYDQRSWHGTNLRGSIRGLSARGAGWRPQPGRHNIWEIVVHAAYWKYVVHRRLTGQPRGSFRLTGSNWFLRPPDGALREWRADVALLDEAHRSMRRAIAVFPSRRLHHRNGRTETNFSLIAGAAAHDLYHAGQIQLLKRLQSGARG
jgi:hypothetical protein